MKATNIGKPNKSPQKRRVVLSLSSSDARNALGFFRREFRVDGMTPTVGEALREMRTSKGKVVADSLVENGRIRPRFGLFLDGTNIENLEGLDTRIRDDGQLVVIELISRIAGG